VIGVDAEDVGAGAAGRNGGFLLAGLAEFYHDAVKKFGKKFALETYKDTVKELELVYKEMPNCTRKTGSLRIAAN
jgi:glycine/D-amino acid oxidase-like deaminating enzyme